MHARVWRVKHFFFIAMEVAVYTYPYTGRCVEAVSQLLLPMHDTWTPSATKILAINGVPCIKLNSYIKSSKDLQNSFNFPGVRRVKILLKSKLYHLFSF